MHAFMVLRIISNCFVLIISVKNLLLGAAVKLRKATVSFASSVRLSVRVEQLGTNWTDFREILCLIILQKSLKNIQILLTYLLTYSMAQSPS